MRISRRSMLGAGLAAPWLLQAAGAKPNSKFGGVQIGVITYSFRALPSGAEEVLRYCVDCGVSGIELMANTPESYAGAPVVERGAAGREQAEALKQWRLTAKMDKYKAFRRMYEDAGVKIYAFKLPPTMAMSDAEYDYIWNVGQTLGASHLTMELPTDDALLQRVAEFAAKRKLPIAFHTHGQGGASGFERALNASKYTALNLDVGHYFGVNGESPVPVIEKYHSRIASLHLKDRKGPTGAPGDRKGGGANMPWGQGQTPLTEILQTMKKNRYTFPASIEYEYQTPEGSDVLTEVKKCAVYCRKALES